MSWTLFSELTDVLLAVAVAASTVFTLLLISLPSRYEPREEPTTKKGGRPTVSVQVVVLGDIGRSPRMQYHALSIAKHGGLVDLIGYNESDVHPDITASPKIRIVPIAPSPKRLQTSNKALFLLLAPVKVLWQISSLYYALGYKSRPSRWMLVQNPPSIPTLAIGQLICFLRKTKLVVDWHNFGYSILALKLGPSHPLVRIAQWYEIFFARAATAHLCVTNVMARVLKQTFNVDALPLHDRPPAHFQPLSPAQQHDVLESLTDTASHAHDLQAGHQKLIVSSTSWTSDEDFSILLDALVAYSAKAIQKAELPRILAIITGKGPQKAMYLTKIARLIESSKLSAVEIKTAWLSMSDYALLLGTADIGISLHTSSSGVDLPMKVVDMFGTGLPVFGWGKFEAWPELVQDDVNGRSFGNSDELSQLLITYFSDGADDRLAALRRGALKECTRRWDDEWDPIAGRLFGLVPAVT